MLGAVNERNERGKEKEKFLENWVEISFGKKKLFELDKRAVRAVNFAFGLS